MTLKTLVFLAMSGAAASAFAAPSAALQGVKGNSIYTYAGYYDASPGGNVWFNWINQFNQGASGNNKITMVNVYASDLEFPNCAKTTPMQVSYNITPGYQLPFNDSTKNNPITCNIGPSTVFSSSAISAPNKKAPADVSYAPIYTYGSTFSQAASVSSHSGFDSYYRLAKTWSNTKQISESYAANTCLAGQNCTTNQSAQRLKQIAVVDGRIDNGYLQGFDAVKDITGKQIDGLTDTQARALAHYVAFGTTDLSSTVADCTPYQPGGPSSKFNGSVCPKDSYHVVGICQEPNFAGVQMDLEPFHIASTATVTNPGGGQASFYLQLGEDLASNACKSTKYPNGKVFSVFTFAKALNTPAIKAIMTHSNNFYAEISLYDLAGVKNGLDGHPSSTPSPLLVGYNGTNYYACANTPDKNKQEVGTGIPTANSNCQGAFGNSATVPHTPTDYATNVALEITDAMNLGIPVRFAIPASASAHEFQSWYTRTGPKCPIGPYAVQKGRAMPVTPCTIPGSGAEGMLIGKNPVPNAMLQYTTAVITALESAKVQSNPNFLGLDIWALSDKMEWSPNNAIISNSTGWPNAGTYVFFEPSTPPANVIGYLQNNLGLNSGSMAISAPTFSVNQNVVTVKFNYSGQVPASVVGFQIELYSQNGTKFKMDIASAYCPGSSCSYSQVFPASADGSYTHGEIYAVDSKGLTVNGIKQSFTDSFTVPSDS